MQINILRVINNLGLGGAQRLLTDYARHHDRERFRLTVAAFDGGECAAEIERMGIEVILCRRRCRYDVTLAVRLAQIIHERRIHLLHANLFAARLWGRLAARWEKIPAVVTQHADVPRLRTPPHLWIEQALAGWTTRWLTDHEGLRRTLVHRYHADPRRVLTLHPAVDPDRLRPGRAPDDVRRMLGLDHPTTVGLWYGRFDHQKGLDILIEALTPELMSSGLTLVLKGDGPDRESLTAEIQQRGLSRTVLFADPALTVGDLLQIADVFILPSRWEGMPLSIIEAAAVGLPILAADLEGTREFKEYYESMTLVHPNEPAIWTTLLRHAAKSPRASPVAGFSAVDRARRLEDLYAAVLNEAHGR